MNIKTKFDLGQFVIIVTRQSVQKVIACDLCKDIKQIEISGTKYKCPKCSDNGLIKWSQRYMITGRGYIGKIQYEEYGTKNVPSEYKNRVEEKYMLDSTGIGSGNVWPVENLFLTEKEAQEFCDKQNAERESQGL